MHDIRVMIEEKEHLPMPIEMPVQLPLSTLVEQFQWLRDAGMTAEQNTMQLRLENMAVKHRDNYICPICLDRLPLAPLSLAEYTCVNGCEHLYHTKCYFEFIRVWCVREWWRTSVR